MLGIEVNATSTPDQETTMPFVPKRDADRPVTTSPNIPHKQRSQNAPADLQEKLWERMLTLPHVFPGPSPISGPATRALHLEQEFANGPVEAFAPDGNHSEFGHLHGADDGSLHMTMAQPDAEAVVEAGRGEWHPSVQLGIFPPNLVMVYGPRTEDEVETIMTIVERSYRHALGPLPLPTS